MNASMMFATLGEIEDQMSGQTLLDDTSALNALDELYEETWKGILTHEPSDYDSTEDMVVYLLAKLTERAQSGENTVKLKEKIIELFQITALGETKQIIPVNEKMPCRRII